MFRRFTDSATEKAQTTEPSRRFAERPPSCAGNRVGSSDLHLAPEQNPQNVTQQLPSDRSELQIDYAKLLCEIAELQESIHSHEWSASASIDFIVRRAQELMCACGAAVAFLEEDRLLYTATAGDAEPLKGSKVSLGRSSLAACARERKPVQVSELATEKDKKPRVRLALSFYRQQEVAGVLELRFPFPKSFQPHELCVCQIISGLLTEALLRGDNLALTKLSKEWGTALRELEKVRSQLEQLAILPETQPDGTNTLPLAAPQLSTSAGAASLSHQPQPCEPVHRMWPLVPVNKGPEKEPQPNQVEPWTMKAALPSPLDEIAARFAAEEAKSGGAAHAAWSSTECVASVEIETRQSLRTALSTGMNYVRERLRLLHRYFVYCATRLNAWKSSSLLERCRPKRSKKGGSTGFEPEASISSPTRHEEPLPPALAEFAARLFAQAPAPERENLLCPAADVAPIAGTIKQQPR